MENAAPPSMRLREEQHSALNGSFYTASAVPASGICMKHRGKEVCGTRRLPPSPSQHVPLCIVLLQHGRKRVVSMCEQVLYHARRGDEPGSRHKAQPSAQLPCCPLCTRASLTMSRSLTFPYRGFSEHACALAGSVIHNWLRVSVVSMRLAAAQRAGDSRRRASWAEKNGCDSEPVGRTARRVSARGARPCCAPAMLASVVVLSSRFNSLERLLKLATSYVSKNF
jgi:hypothetical protein